MNTASTRKSSRQTSAPSRFEQNADAMFGSGALRRVGRYGLLTVIAFGMLAVGTASADWWVKDRELLDAVGRKGSTDTGSLQGKLYGMRVQGSAYNPTENDEVKSKRAVAPDQVAVTTIKERRCKTANPEQKPVCEEIVQLEADRYKYLQEMRKLSEKRENQLKDVYTERNGIASNDQGKLQSNTNRLLALLTHQRIDQLNMDMAMATFDERIRERKEHLDYLAKGAMDPRNKEGDLLDTIIGGAGQLATLELALQAAREAHDR